MSELPLGHIAEQALANAGGLALVDANTERTWAQCADELPLVASAMLALAPSPDERWGVLGDNFLFTIMAHSAGLMAGVGTVAVSRQLMVRELADQIEDAHLVGLITGPSGLESCLAALRDGLVTRVVIHSCSVPADAPSGAISWDAWLAETTLVTDFPTRPARPIMVYTSGTTGRARGTETRWVLAKCETSKDYLDKLCAKASYPAGAHIIVGPLQHNGPLTAMRHFLMGGCVVVLNKFDGEEVLRLIQEHKVSSSVMVPTHFQRLLAVDESVRAKYDVSSLAMVAHTGSACPADVKMAMIDWWGPVLVESYGGSESGTLCRINSNEWLAHPGSVGKAVDPYVIHVFDEAGNELARNETGILAFEAPEGFGITYHQDPEKTAKAYIKPGIFTLGDMGHVDDEGFIYITDRLSDMVVSGGVNLYPSESENALREHPGVAEVAVIGIPHKDLGEQLLALVVATDPANPPSAEELETFCRERIAAYKIPRKYEFIAELPRNEMQKVDKKGLRKPYWDSDRTIGG